MNFNYFAQTDTKHAQVYGVLVCNSKFVHLFIGFRAKRKIDSVVRLFRMRTFAERTLI